MTIVPLLLVSCLAGDVPADPTVAEVAGPTLVEFQRDVVPALTKAGCNVGACHGSFQGRGGLQLSLLGFDPAYDHDALVLSARGRRIARGRPEESLILRKASGQMPHGGGRRISADSAVYRILKTWIGDGVPGPVASAPQVVRIEAQPTEIAFPVVGTTAEPVQMTVTATWSDGSTQDVTPWALYDIRRSEIATISRSGLVMPAEAGRTFLTARYQGQVAAVPVTRPFATVTEPVDFPSHNFIDELVKAEWQRLGLKPAPIASDTEFVRRPYLDLIGTLPTPDEVRAFLESNDPDKRTKLIDALLERREFVDFWSLRWSDLLRSHRRYVGDKGLASFHGWIRQSVRENTPLDQMARSLLTSQGNLFTSGPVAYYFIDEKPEDLAETTAQVFLGVRLQCTRCHHHPMETWAQEDYYGLAAFFTRLEAKDSGDQGRFGGGRSIRAASKPLKQLAFAAEPRIFGETPADLTTAADPRSVLADWLTQPENPWFARNFANRYWAWLVGRGLVEPVDDFRATNPASNPALLDALAKHLAENRFNAKALIRTICTSRVYQLASEVNPTRDKDGTFFTHRVPRRISAEVLLDAVNQVCGTTETFPQMPAGTRAIALPDPTIPSDFLTTFGRPLRNSACECARGMSPDLSQALHLVNSPALQSRIAHADGRLTKLLKTHPPEQNDTAITELYLAALARMPRSEELQTIQQLLAESTSRQEVFEDLLWTLLNMGEFVFNH